MYIYIFILIIILYMDVYTIIVFVHYIGFYVCKCILVYIIKRFVYVDLIIREEKDLLTA